MCTRLYAGSPLKQDSFERAQALELEGKTGGTERAKRHAIFSARSLPVKRNGTERERKRSIFLTPTVHVLPTIKTQTVEKDKAAQHNTNLKAAIFNMYR